MNLESSQKSFNVVNLGIHMLKVFLSLGKQPPSLNSNTYIQKIQIIFGENIYTNMNNLSKGQYKEKSLI